MLTGQSLMRASQVSASSRHKMGPLEISALEEVGVLLAPVAHPPGLHAARQLGDVDKAEHIRWADGVLASWNAMWVTYVNLTPACCSNRGRTYQQTLSPRAAGPLSALMDSLRR